jgi:quinolinate synthase
VHEQYSAKDVGMIRKNYPDAIILAHPECRPEVVNAADFSGSTSSMTKYVRDNGFNKKIALLTECSMADNLCATIPENASNLIRMCSLHCKHMRTITLEQLLDSLLANIYEIEIPDKIREKAELSVKRMIEIN